MEQEEQDLTAQFPVKKLNNTLPIFGNKDTMNINSMILTNIHQSRYFKTELFELKTFHEVVDEIYYRVTHLEPWERNSRKLAGQVGMCAGVRGVAAGGIVSTPFCLLFKLFTLRLTRKQLTVMINHSDSPYIRGLGFMYVRYCQPPNDFLSWFGDYLDDEEEIDLKAGGGFVTTVGGMCRMMLTKMEWFGTMFPRMPMNVQKDIRERLKEISTITIEREKQESKDMESPPRPEREKSPDRHRRRSRDRSPPERRRSSERKRSPRRRSRERDSRRSSYERHRSHSRERDSRRHRSRSRDRRSDDRHSRRNRSRSRSRDRHRHRSRSRDRGRR